MLNDLMEFEHVIQVHSNGSVTDATDVYAPSLYDNELDDESWSLMHGYSGQSGYTGPVMHNSEFIGGQMERDILANPGYYVAIAAYWPTDDENDDDIEGWAVAYRES